MSTYIACPTGKHPFGKLPEGKGLWEVSHGGCDYPTGGCSCYCGINCGVDPASPQQGAPAAPKNPARADVWHCQECHEEILWDGTQWLHADGSGTYPHCNNKVIVTAAALAERTGGEPLRHLENAVERMEKWAIKNGMDAQAGELSDIWEEISRLQASLDSQPSPIAPPGKFDTEVMSKIRMRAEEGNPIAPADFLYVLRGLLGPLMPLELKAIKKAAYEISLGMVAGKFMDPAEIEGKLLEHLQIFAWEKRQ